MSDYVFFLGEELFPAFIRLIRTCDDTEEGHEQILKLIKWIDEKEFFWTQQSKFTYSFTSLQQSVCDLNASEEDETEGRKSVVRYE